MPRKPESPATVDAIVQPLTPTQRDVLRRLACGDWVMDYAGSDGMAATMSGPGWGIVKVAAKTVSYLLAEGLITTSTKGISNYEITALGRSRVG